jgi:hypothetical protein
MNDEILSKEECKRKKKNAAQLAYYYRHKQKLLEYQKLKRATDPKFKERHRVYSKAYTLRNPEKRKSSVKKYYDANSSKCCAASVKSMKKVRAVNGDAVRLKQKQYFQKNATKWKAYFRSYTRDFRKTKQGKVASKIRGRIWALIKSNGITTKRTYVDSFGILNWFEWLKFKGVVDWTQPGIDVDHVIPISAFNLTDEGVMRYANKWWNLLPMMAFNNRSKGAKICRATYQKARKLVAEYIYETGASTSY